MKFTEKEILEQLDLAFYEKPSKYFPVGEKGDIKYNFFLDLEHGYFETAGSKIHLYADSTRWAIIFEKSGYQNRGTSAEIELYYFGNCIEYTVDHYSDQNYISNMNTIILIDSVEFELIENKKGESMETFEVIGQNIKSIKIRDKVIPFESDYRQYENVGIKLRKENSRKLIGFGDLIRYLNETNSTLISATEDDIKKHIPVDLHKLMTIEKFHYESLYDKSIPPSKQETYKLIAKILTELDHTTWKPTETPNNHWANWESGNL
jgi:hypothetical protein